MVKICLKHISGFIYDKLYGEYTSKPPQYILENYYKNNKYKFTIGYIFSPMRDMQFKVIKISEKSKPNINFSIINS